MPYMGVCRSVIGNSEFVLDFRQVAPFLNAGEPTRSGVEHRRPISDFVTPVNIRGAKGEMF